MSSVIGKWRNMTGRRITDPQTVIPVIVEPYAGANPAAENGLARVVFTISDSLGNSQTIPVTTRSWFVPYYSEFSQSHLPGVTEYMTPVWGMGLLIPASSIAYGTVTITAKVVANNSAEYVLPDSIVIYNDSDGADRRPSNKVLYVAASGGNDANPGTIGSPLATIQKAITLAVKTKATANTIYASADAGGAEIILLDGTHSWVGNTDYSLYTEYWHTSGDWWLTIKSLTGNAIITRPVDPSDTRNNIYPQAALFAYGWRASDVSPWQGNRNIRFANLKIQGAGAVFTTTSGIRVWIDGGSSYSTVQRITDNTVMYVSGGPNNGNLPSIESNLGTLYCSSHQRHHVGSGWNEYDHIVDCSLSHTTGISILAVDAQGFYVNNCLFTNSHSYLNVGGTITDGYVWVADGSKLTVSIPSPGLMRVDSTQSLGTLANDYRSISTNGFASQFNHIIAANAALGSTNVGVGFRNFPASGNNGFFRLVSAGVNGNGTEYVVCENSNAVAQTGQGGIPGSTTEMFTAILRGMGGTTGGGASAQYNDANHPDILQCYGSNQNFLVSNVAVSNYADTQGWYYSASGGQFVNCWLVNVSDGGRGVTSNFAGSGLVDCGFVNTVFSGDLQFGGGPAKVNCTFVDNVFRLTSNAPAHGTSATSCYWSNNHWILIPPYFGADAVRGLNTSSGSWFKFNPAVAPYDHTPLDAQLGTGAGFVSTPSEYLWPGTLLPTKGVWPNVGLADWQDVSLSVPSSVTVVPTTLTLSLTQPSATGSVDKSVTSASLSLTIGQNSPTIRVRANVVPTTSNLTLKAPSNTRVYQGPGTNAYRSTKFTASVDGESAYVYGLARTSVIPTSVWNLGDMVEMSFVKYETDFANTVSIGLVTGSITSAVVYPKNVATQLIVGGILILGVPKNTNLRVEVNNDRANVMHVFSCPPKRAVGVATNWTSIPSSTVSSINLSTNTITCSAPHGLSAGQRVILSSTGTMPAVTGTAVTDLSMTYVSFASGADLRLSRSPGGADIDFTSSGSGTISVKRATMNPGEAIYFGPGVHRIGQLFDLSNNCRIYADADSVLIGSFDLRGCDGVVIEGFGLLLGLYAEYEDVSLDFELAKPYTMFFGYDGVKFFFDNELQGVTVGRCPFYFEFVGLNRILNVQLINMWCYTQNGFSLIARTPSDSTASLIDCFGITGDDNLTLGEQASSLKITVSRVFACSTTNSVAHLSYWPDPVVPGSFINIDDCHFMHLGTSDSGSNTYPVFGSRTIFKALADGAFGEEAEGRANIFIRRLKVWGPNSGRFTILGNIAYPFGTAANQVGQLYNMLLEDIDLEYVPQQISYIIGKDAVNTPHDVTINNLRIGGTQVTPSNFDDYFIMNAHPYNIILDGQQVRLFADATTQNLSLQQLPASVSIPESTTGGLLSLTLTQPSATVVVAATIQATTQTIVTTQLSAFASVFTAPIAVVQNLTLAQQAASSRVVVVANGSVQSLTINAVDQPQDIPAYAATQSMSLAQQAASVKFGSSTSVALQTMNIQAPVQPQSTLASAGLQLLNLTQYPAVAVGSMKVLATPVTMSIAPIDAYGVNPGTVISSTLNLGMLIFSSQARIRASIESTVSYLSLALNDGYATAGSSTVVARQNMFFTQNEAESTSASSTTNIPQILDMTAFDATVKLGTRVDVGTLGITLTQITAQVGNEALARHEPIYTYLLPFSTTVVIPGTANGEVNYLDMATVNVLLDTSVEAVADTFYLSLTTSPVEAVGFIALPTQPTLALGAVRDLLTPEIQYDPDIQEEWRIVQS